ncbi:class I SAM-dependent methyltransferase [Myxococcota bacterium]
MQYSLIGRVTDSSAQRVPSFVASALPLPDCDTIIDRRKLASVRVTPDGADGAVFRYRDGSEAKSQASNEHLLLRKPGDARFTTGCMHTGRPVSQYPAYLAALVQRNHFSSKRVLDVPAGKGVLVGELLNADTAQVLGIDIAPILSTRVFPGRLGELPTYDQSVDTILSLYGPASSPHYDWRAFLLDLVRTLAPGGELIIGPFPVAFLPQYLQFAKQHTDLKETNRYPSGDRCGRPTWVLHLCR